MHMCAVQDDIILVISSNKHTIEILLLVVVTKQPGSSRIWLLQKSKQLV